MRKRTERTERAVYEFPEKEFKQLLGISDPEAVLTVSSNGFDSTVTVYLMQPEGMR